MLEGAEEVRELLMLLYQYNRNWCLVEERSRRGSTIGVSPRPSSPRLSEEQDRTPGSSDRLVVARRGFRSDHGGRQLHYENSPADNASLVGRNFARTSAPRGHYRTSRRTVAMVRFSSWMCRYEGYRPLGRGSKAGMYSSNLLGA